MNKRNGKKSKNINSKEIKLNLKRCLMTFEQDLDLFQEIAFS